MAKPDNMPTADGPLPHCVSDGAVAPDEVAGRASSGAVEAGREELHFRRIDMRGFRRRDGLFEIEGRVVDRKPFDFISVGGGKTVPANQPIHDMGVRLVFDDAMVVHEVHAFTDSAPYAACPEAGRAMQTLVGLRMSSGWNREVRNRLAGARGCTHLMELLQPLATAAFQSLSKVRMGQPEKFDANGRPAKIDSCFAYAAGGELVLQRWPAFHRPEDSAT